MNIMTRLRLSRLTGRGRRHDPTYGEYCLLHGVGAMLNHDEVVSRADKPRRLCGRWMPDTLDGMSMGRLIDVLGCKDETKLLTVMYDVTESELQAERATNVIGAIKWTAERLKSITDLFCSLEKGFSPEELAAGADMMRGDVFTTIDWYARRMGITDHDMVLKVPWITIWRCAKDDREQEEYKQRIRRNRI